MKKPKRTKLHVERDVLRTLQAHEIAVPEGGNALTVNCQQQVSTDTVRLCCA